MTPEQQPSHRPEFVETLPQKVVRANNDQYYPATPNDIVVLSKALIKETKDQG